MVDLGGDAGVADDGAGDQRREHRLVHGEGNQAALGGDGAAADVDEIGDALEDEERDAERQADRRQRPADLLGGEVGVFVDHQQSEIGADTDGERGTATRRRKAEPIVQPDAQQQHRKGGDVSPGIEHQARGEQGRIPPRK